MDIVTPLSSREGLKQSARMTLYHSIGRHPGLTAVLLAVLFVIILIVVFALVACKAKCSVKRNKMHVGYPSNLKTGSNNPQWHMGGHDSGWGGNMHTSQDTDGGETRPYGATGSGVHELDRGRHPGAHSCVSTSSGAIAEAQASHALQSVNSNELSNTSVGAYLDRSEENTPRKSGDDHLSSFIYGGGPM